MLYFLVLFFYSAANQRRGSGKTIGRLASALLLASGSAGAPGWVVGDSLGQDWEVWILVSIKVLRVNHCSTCTNILRTSHAHAYQPKRFPTGDQLLRRLSLLSTSRSKTSRERRQLHEL